MKAKIITLFLILAASMGNIHANVKIGDLYYNLDATNLTAEVTYSWYSGTYSQYNYEREIILSATIPSSITYEGMTYKVTSIGDHAFERCRELTSVTIPNTITSIGNETFKYCRGLSYVTIPNSVTNIGNQAFDECSGLTSIIIPDNVISIGEGAFANCSRLTSVTVGNSVTSIGQSAFFECSSLASIIIGKGVTDIGDSAFKGCSQLTTVVWNAKSFGKNFTSTKTPFYYYNSSNTYASYDLRSQITSFVFGDEVEFIPAYLCYGMQNITFISIPNNLSRIGSSAFSGCGLNRVQINNIASWCDVTFGDDYSNPLYVAKHLFSNGEEVTVLNIPSGVPSIGKSVFRNCVGLISIEIPNSVTSIAESAFEGCSNLESISIGKEVTYIGNRVLRGCNKLTSVVWNVKKYADFTYSKTPFKSTSGYTTETFDLCKQITIFVFGNEVESIPAYLCDGMNNLSSLTIPNSVTSIGQNAFSYCQTIISVTIPNSVTSIGNSAFYGCSGMTSVIIPNSVTSIGTSVFYGCSSLTSVTIPNSVTSIGNSAFYGCSSMTSVIIPNSVASIGISVFSGCFGLTSVTIPNGVTNIGNSVFANCSNLTSIIWKSKNCASPSEYKNAPFYDIRSQINTFVLGDEVESIPAYLCYGMNQIATISFPNSVESIGNSTFQGCSGLTSLILPQQVTSIGEYSFNYCNGLTSVTLQSETPPSIGNNAFSNCSNLLGIYVPCGKLDAYKRAWSKYTSYIAYTPTGYTINAGINMTEAGNVAVLNSVCETSVTANSNYGYHFAQWLDGNADNPRTIELTKDTTFTAEFAKNSYSITTASSNEEWGTTEGDATVLYQDHVEISATANYGYHFTQWNDGNSNNPRTITITKDATYTATFAKNTYKITKITDNTQGSISGYSQAYYLNQVTLTAVPKYGYHFMQWSDGVTDNPRTFELTRDTTFTAEFAVDKSGTCGNNNQLTWEFDAESKTLAISGEGQLNSNYTFGVEAPTQTERLIIEEGVTSIGNNAFKDKCATITALALPSTVTVIGDYAFAGLNNRNFKTLVLPNTITSIGAHAFDGASYMQTIHFGSALEVIGDSAFNGCTRVRQMTCLAEITPNVGTDGLTSISSLAKLYVPDDYLFDYQLDNNWNRFQLLTLGATETTVDDNNVAVSADDNTVTLTWPTTANANSYTIEITKEGVVFCQLIFNASGQLTSIAFAPSRGGQSMAPAATMTANGMQFTVTGLNSGTSYGYSVEAKSGNTTVASYSGSFATTGGIATGIDEVTAISAPQKVLRNGNVLILRDGKTYTVTGQEIQ